MRSSFFSSCSNSRWRPAGYRCCPQAAADQVKLFGADMLACRIANNRFLQLRRGRAGNAVWPRRSTADQFEEARLEFGTYSLQEPALADLAVPDRDSCGQARYQRYTGRHVIDRDPDGHALRQAHPSVNWI